jgi:DNA-binding transcriptional LysR family regulator
VHRAGSITGAARDLGVAQPTVTRQIRALEARVGAALFARQVRGVVPTAAADRLARAMAPHLDALAEVVSRDLSGPGAAQVLHLAGPADLIGVVVLPALAGLLPDGPRLRVALGETEPLLDGLLAGEHDLVIATVRPRRRGISSEPLGDEEFVLVAAPSWLDRLPVDPGRDAGRALDALPLVAYAEELPVIRRYWRVVFERPARGQATVVVPDLRSVRAAVRAGIGISVLPRYLVAGDLADRSLVALLEPELPPINTLHLALRAGTAGLPHIAGVREALLAHGRTW